MRKSIFGAGAALVLLGAQPAFADEHDGHHGRDRGGHQIHQNHGDGDYRGRSDSQFGGYRQPAQGYRADDRQDYRENRRIYRDGYFDGRRDDYANDRRIYRDRYFDARRGGYFDGRRYASYAYRPYFQPFYQYDRPYYRFDHFDGAWGRPYVIGRPLPRHLRYSRIRDGYYGGLPPCPNGYYYANVGGDILLLSLATNLVVDALLFGNGY